MSTKVRLELLPGFRTIIGEQPDTQLILHLAATAAVPIAKADAPVVSGAYRDSIEADGPRLQATDFKAGWIEFGTVRTKARRTLTNAARRVARVVAT